METMSSFGIGFDSSLFCDARLERKFSCSSSLSLPLSFRLIMNKLFERRSNMALGYDEFFELSSIEPNIRTIIDQETTGIIFERRLPINVIFGGIPDVGPILDQITEDRRIRTNIMQQRAVSYTHLTLPTTPYV